MNEKFEEFKRMEIIDARYRGKMSLTQLADFVREVKNSNESILIILNTKKSAEAVYQEVKKKLRKEDIIFYFLSTNLCPDHRKKRIKEMKDALGSCKQVICVSTQLIEAGVDISFSCVIRNLAGLDSIVQASGRGNRNGEGEIKNTYIIELEEELGSLEDIKLGQDCTTYVLDEYRRNMKRFDNNLLSPKAIQRYYDYFYHEGAIESRMDYPVLKTSVYKMLSQPKKKHAYENSTNQKYPLVLEFQFKTAGKFFEVIDEYAETVMVPYGNGKNIISELQTPYKSMPKIELIRSIQPYVVNVSRNTMQKLRDRNAVYIEKKSGVWILENNFYDEELGVVPEGRIMSPLIIG